MYKLSFFVPIDDVEIVKNALFSIGAGKIGNYDHCCWQALGTGQFRPLNGSDPHIGKVDVVEQVSELKVEMVVEDHLAVSAITALLESHPYETPAYDLQKIFTFDDFKKT